MSIRILYVPDGDLDIPADKWLALAASDDEDRRALTKAHAGVAANGYCVHVATSEGVECFCGNAEHHEKMNKLMEDFETIPYAFSINRQFLLEALSGILDEDNGMINFYFQAKDKPVAISETSGARAAVIMPMKNETPASLKLIRIKEGVGKNQ